MGGGDEAASDQVADELDRFAVDEVPVFAGTTVQFSRLARLR